jgi:uncharacterized membrane protein
MFIVGTAALALAASTIVLPSAADAKGRIMPHRSQGHPGGRVAGNFRGHRGPGGYVGGYYYGGYCGPIQITLGLCGPWGY